jgi:hypothetical protein
MPVFIGTLQTININSTIRHISATPPPPIKGDFHPPGNSGYRPSSLIKARKSLQNHPRQLGIPYDINPARNN